MMTSGQSHRFRACRHLSQASAQTEMQPGKEVSCGLFVAGRDGPKMLDDIEEPLDEIALAIECEVAVPFDLAV